MGAPMGPGLGGEKPALCLSILLVHRPAWLSSVCVPVSLLGCPTYQILPWTQAVPLDNPAIHSTDMAPETQHVTRCWDPLLTLAPLPSSSEQLLSSCPSASHCFCPLLHGLGPPPGMLFPVYPPAGFHLLHTSPPAFPSHPSRPTCFPHLALPPLSQSETYNLALNYTLCSLIILCLISQAL
jgi:hypothetical protein